MRRRVLRAATLIASVGLLAFASGCDEKLSDIAGPSPGLTPTYSSIAQNIFASTDGSGRTACTQCHTNQGRVPAANLNLLPEAGYAQLVGVASVQKPGAIRVIPGDADGSYLVHKLDGRADIVGQRMPRNAGPFLTEGQMLIIRRWIDQGAQNN
ncbi:hypothetical protein [Luteitalea sp.]|jgi:hypothetical protein|uniref:hypothetical protein n=1 Tax=Luteitalea sp. TaxID=2004800 RepID=UPI0025C04B15|nr:hypothetical protein [Luteitalea sp.]